MGKKISDCTRRAFLRSALGVAAGAPLGLSVACGGGSQPAPAPRPPENLRSDARVAIVACSSYDGTAVHDSLQQAFDLLGGIQTLVSGKIVTVKINLTCSGYFENQFGLSPGESYITHGSTAYALASLLLSAGALRVRFVESAPFLAPLDQVLSQAEWDVPALLALGNVELENTRNLGSGQAYTRLYVPGGGYLFSYFELNHSYQDTDVFVSLGKLKQHITAGITLSMKNVFGITPNSVYGSEAGSEDALGWRSPLHGDGTGGWGSIPLPGARTELDPDGAGYRIPRIIADLCAARPVHLAIIDGITAMSGGEGPWVSNPAPTSPHVMIAGLNPVSTDAVAIAVMGYANPRATRGTRPFSDCDNHVLLAEQSEIGAADLSQIDVRGMTIQQAMYPYPG
jgi:uncharacterized protein (DUF362 family)